MSVAIILMFSAIEALAQALRRTNKKPSEAKNFKHWVSLYLHLPGDSPTSDEWWSTRCAIIHSYGVTTERHRHDPNHSIVLWLRAEERRSFRRRLKAGNFVCVNVLSMHDAFQQGVQNSLIQAAKDKKWWPTIEKRLNQFVQPIPIDPTGRVAGLVSEG